MLSKREVLPRMAAMFAGLLGGMKAVAAEPTKKALEGQVVLMELRTHFIGRDEIMVSTYPTQLTDPVGVHKELDALIWQRVPDLLGRW